MASVLAVYGTCQTGCNTAWVVCCAAAGGVAGTFTGGVGLAPGLVLCGTHQGACMMACAAMSGIAGVTEVGTAVATSGAAGAAVTTAGTGLLGMGMAGMAGVAGVAGVAVLVVGSYVL